MFFLRKMNYMVNLFILEEAMFRNGFHHHARMFPKTGISAVSIIHMMQQV